MAKEYFKCNINYDFFISCVYPDKYFYAIFIIGRHDMLYQNAKPEMFDETACLNKDIDKWNIDYTHVVSHDIAVLQICKKW